MCLMAILNPKDEVLVYEPAWVSFTEQIRLAYGIPVHIPYDETIYNFEKYITDKTKMIIINNPNNPTGHIMSSSEMDAVVAAADRVGAWLLADEVYSGTERLTDEKTPSFWSRYDKVLANNSLSKAYGLPGLRVGWIVGPPDVIDAAWARHEYTTCL